MDEVKLANAAPDELVSEIEPTQIEKNLLFKTSGLDVTSVEAKKQNILKMMKSDASITIENGVSFKEPLDHGVVGASYPVIVLISGAGGNGKDTFIESAGKHCSILNLSSINEIKECANLLVGYSDKYDLVSEATICAGKHQEEKSDRYRQFLHELKTAWTNFCDGPNNVLIGEIRNTISEQLDGGVGYDAIFLHVREPAEQEKLYKIITEKLGLICFSVLVKGLVEASSYENDCDKNVEVEGYTYDMTIMNHADNKALFEMQAMLFGSTLITANNSYGIPIYKTAVAISDTAEFCTVDSADCSGVRTVDGYNTVRSSISDDVLVIPGHVEETSTKVSDNPKSGVTFLPDLGDTGKYWAK